MKAEELMIGDWVYQAQFEDCTKPYTGHGWKPVKVTSVPFDKDYFIEPITLTPEILEKNGFSVGDDNKLTYWKWDDGEISISICYGQNYIEDLYISYVHQLQHALRLCGIEKEITL